VCPALVVKVRLYKTHDPAAKPELNQHASGGALPNNSVVADDTEKALQEVELCK
jgi:hypothetical protein